MKKRGINKNVIVATSYNAAEVIREVSEFGVNYYILKPFDLTDLEKRIYEISNKKQGSKNIDFYNSNLQGIDNQNASRTWNPITHQRLPIYKRSRSV